MNVWVNLRFELFGLKCEMTITPLERVLGHDREYSSNAFWELLASHGIMYHISYTNTPYKNVVAKRKHRHIIEIVRSLLLSTCIPIELWGRGSSFYYSSLN